MKKNEGLQLIDFKKGRISPNKVNAFTLSTMTNSCSKAKNVDFDRKIGSVVPRKGCNELASLSGTYHGSGVFKNKNGTVNVFLQSRNALIDVWNGTSITTSAFAIHATNKFRTATLGGRVFAVDGAKMFSSADGINWDLTNCIAGVAPSIITRNKQHMLCAGDTANPDRVYFSSVIDPTLSPFIKWNTSVYASADGGWIDVNPDDNSNITALEETSDTLLVFKENSIYRVDAITKSVSPTNIYNIGAPSQEAVTRCRGMVYFYSGQEILRTDGSYPEQISRLAIQDYLDVIVDKTAVNLYSDERTVYVSIGNVTLKGEGYKNVVLKFSVLDESWTLYEYPFFVKNTELYKEELVGMSGDKLSKLQTGFTDFGGDIPFNFETQNLFITGVELKTITDRIVFISRNATSTNAYCVLDGLGNNRKIKDMDVKLSDIVIASKPSNLEFRTIAFGWQGIANDGIGDNEPELLGIQVEVINSLGMAL